MWHESDINECYCVRHCYQYKTRWFFRNSNQLFFLNIATVKACQCYFDFELLSVILVERTDKFEQNFKDSSNSYCERIPYFLLLSDISYECVNFFLFI